jgi:hypothetical protein
MYIYLLHMLSRGVSNKVSASHELIIKQEQGGALASLFPPTAQKVFLVQEDKNSGRRSLSSSTVS